MKNSVRILLRVAAIVFTPLTVAAVSCNKIPSENVQGTLSWNFSSHLSTRSALDLPDTDAFVLTVRNSAGETLYEGEYGKSPESMLVNPGSYTVRAVSRKFEKPEFSAPQFGDEQVVVVQSGKDAKARLNCTQLNSGIRLKIDPDFKSVYPNGSVKVTSSSGELGFSLTEKRIGYFSPGNVSVVMNDGTSSNVLLTRFLDPCEILTLGISCPSSKPSEPGKAGSLSITVDTSRVWNSLSYEIGSGSEGNPGTSQSTAYSVAQAKEHIGEKGVWVCGYIVGGDLTSSKEGISFNAPFTSMTCIAIASRSSVTAKSSCLSVKLAKGEIRSALNLADHPELLGCKVYLKGDLTAAYYGIPGVENLTEYAMK